MPSTSKPAPAHRFLHVCYCCSDLDEVVGLLVDGLGLRESMRTPIAASDGDVLGMPGDIVSGAAFVYDGRGPRVSPAIEVQVWVDPPAVGTPPDDPTVAGIQALGFAVADVDAVVARLIGLGCVAVHRADRWTAVADRNGVTLDVVHDPSVPAGKSRLRHLRITSTDLDASVRWYTALGFDVIERRSVATGDVVRLRLPDEPFEAVLVEWHTPPSHGRHTPDPNRIGLYRAALGVDDTRASYATMVADGWRFDRPPVPIRLTGTPVPEMWICFLSDPDGVPYELVQRPRSAFRS